MAHRFFLGCDLGQGSAKAGKKSDRTAVAVIELVWPMKPKTPRQVWGKPSPPPVFLPSFHLRHLGRMKIGVPYPQQVSEVKKLMERPMLLGTTDLVVDGTGVGRAVVDMFRQAGLKPTAVTITSGMETHFVDGYWRCPKAEIISDLQVLFAQQRLRFAAELPLLDKFKTEMLAFTVEIDKRTAHESFEGRKGEHDDIVLAVAIAAWRARRVAGGAPSRPRLAMGARRFGKETKPEFGTKQWWERPMPPWDGKS